jgi:hypothetical protein
MLSNVYPQRAFCNASLCYELGGSWNKQSWQLVSVVEIVLSSKVGVKAQGQWTESELVSGLRAPTRAILGNFRVRSFVLMPIFQIS